MSTVVQDTNKRISCDKVSPKEFQKYKVINKVQEITGEIVGRIFRVLLNNYYKIEGKTFDFAEIYCKLKDVVIKNSFNSCCSILWILHLFPNYRRVMGKLKILEKFCLQINLAQKSSRK